MKKMLGIHSSFFANFTIYHHALMDGLIDFLQWMYDVRGGVKLCVFPFLFTFGSHHSSSN